MKKQLVIKPEVCIGCRSCELICAFNQTKEFGSISSAITIFEFDASNIIVPLMCMQCEDPHCVKACPVEALTKCEKTGVVSYDAAKCIMCKMCLNACPLGNISFDVSRKKLVKCTLCDGDPMCIKICPVGAVDYVDVPDDINIRPL